MGKKIFWSLNKTYKLSDFNNTRKDAFFSIVNKRIRIGNAHIYIILYFFFTLRWTCVIIKLNKSSMNFEI